MRWGSCATLLALLATLSGCAHTTAADRAPRTDPVTRLKPSGPSPWTVDFADPVLADLLRRGDAGAVDVTMALARLERARADVETAEASRWPVVTIGADAAGGGGSFHDVRSAATPTLEAAYEVDVWHRLDHARQAAVDEQAAAASDVAAARLVVAAETVRAYGALRSAQDARAGLEHRVRLAGQNVELTQHRVAEGVAGPDALETARQLAAQAQDALQASQEEETLQSARLADLTGSSSGAVPPGPPLLAGPAATEVSSDVVAARPDVQAALWRLTSADNRRAEAVAASRPRFRINALLGAPDAAIATLLDVRALTWALAASITHDVLDGGASRARIHAQSAEADLADLAYRKAVLAAWSEVRTALVANARAQRELSLAQGAVAQAQSASQIGRTRHGEGAADGFSDIALQSAMETAEDQLRAARSHATEARVELALAGGGR